MGTDVRRPQRLRALLHRPRPRPRAAPRPDRRGRGLSRDHRRARRAPLQRAFSMTEPRTDDPVRRDVHRYYRLVAPYIDFEIWDRDDEPFWAGLAREPGVRRILELGAGTGRVTRHLTVAGAVVV